MNALGFLYCLNGYKVFTNQEYLIYPHVTLRTIEDIKSIYLYPKEQKKIMLMEDFERWMNSRLSSNTTNITIASITMDNGKNNTSLIWTSKRSAIMDISIRDTTDYFIEVKMILPFRPNLEPLGPLPEETKNQIEQLILQHWATDFEKLAVQINIFDSNLKPLKTQYLFNLPFWGNLYNTQEIINEIKK